MIPGRQYTLDDVLRMGWGRKWLILVPLVLVTTATVVVSSRLPDRFRAETLILTVPQRVPQEYVRATVTAEIKDRLPQIKQQILSRTRLERIIQEFDLYAQARRTRPIEAIVAQMGNSDIEVEIVEGSQSFRVSYEAESPVLAMQVTKRLAGLFIEENLHDREVLAKATSEFLESQLEDASRRLVDQEKRLEAYRLRYGPELPTQLPSNMQAIQNVQMQIQALGEGLNRDRDRRLIVARQLADLQSELFLAEPGTAAAPSPERSSASTRLEAARVELNALELRLTAEHPDLMRARRLVADLESEAQKEAAAAAAANARGRPLTGAEIVRRNRVSELQAEIESLDRQIQNKITEETELRAVLQTYQSRTEAVPTRESELAALTRDYDTLQTLYRSLLTKKEDSKIAENLERRQVGEQFKILDPPRQPEKPFRPNRLLIDLLGALGGLAFGIALAALVEFRDKSLKVEADVHTALALPVLAMIPPMMSSPERRRARWRKVGFSLVLGTVFGACAAAVWLTFRA